MNGVEDHAHAPLAHRFQPRVGQPLDLHGLFPGVPHRHRIKSALSLPTLKYLHRKLVIISADRNLAFLARPGARSVAVGYRYAVLGNAKTQTIRATGASLLALDFGRGATKPV